MKSILAFLVVTSFASFSIAAKSPKRGPASYGKIPKCDQGTEREPFSGYFITFELGKNGHGKSTKQIAKFVNLISEKTSGHYTDDNVSIQEIRGDYGNTIVLGFNIPINSPSQVKNPAFVKTLNRLSAMDGVGISCDYLSVE